MDDPIDLLNKLKHDGIQVSSFRGIRCYLHDDHRWVLPIVHEAQSQGILPKPCVWIMFDQHRDDVEPGCKEALCKLRSEGLTTDGLIKLCDSNLRKLDDDWLKAGMELGLFADAVIFGATDTFEARNEFEDHTGTLHRIQFCGFPHGELQYQGKLSDVANSTGLRTLWDILGWQPGKGFKKDLPKVGLDFDLDLFTCRCREITFPWPEEVLEKEFLESSTYWSTEGWSAQRFLQGLISKAGLITIAREPQYCGGQEKADWIFERINHYAFNDGLLFTKKAPPVHD